MPFIFVEKDISLTLIQYYYFSGSRADIQADFVNIHNRILLIGYINNKIRYISLTLMSDAANVRNLLEKVSDCLYLTFCRQHD